MKRRPLGLTPAEKRRHDARTQAIDIHVAASLEYIALGRHDAAIAYAILALVEVQRPRPPEEPA